MDEILNVIQGIVYKVLVQDLYPDNGASLKLADWLQEVSPD